MLGLLFLLAAPVAAPPPPPEPAGKLVAPLTIEGRAKPQRLPGWSLHVDPLGWPLAGVAPDGAVLMFAKTAKDQRRARLQQVMVRREYAAEQSDVAGVYQSEWVAQEVDCATGGFRNLTLHRFAKNNLGGAAKTIPLDETDWTKPAPGSFADTLVADACAFEPALAQAAGSP